MPDNKQSCKKCKGRHAPPTGKKCQRASTSESQEHLSDAAVSSGSKEKDAPDGQLLQHAILDQLERVNGRLDQVEDTMAGTTTESSQKLNKNIVTSTVRKDKIKKTLPVLSDTDSSSDESEVPSLCVLK